MAFFLEKQKTTSTPYVLIDEANGYMRLEGRSFHENIIAFYREVNEWLDGFLASDFEALTCDFEMNYFNSSTSKLLHNMLLKLDRRASAGKGIVVNWITTEDNEIIIECGEDFQEEIESLTFNMILK